MHRHSIDLAGLLFGLAFTIAGTSFLVRETTRPVLASADRRGQRRGSADARAEG